MSELSVVEEYAIWLAETGVSDSAHEDLNEGCDPISGRGEEVSDEDWRAAKNLARDISTWIRANPGQLLAAVVGSQESTGAAGVDA